MWFNDTALDRRGALDWPEGSGRSRVTTRRLIAYLGLSQVDDWKRPFNPGWEFARETVPFRVVVFVESNDVDNFY